MHILAIHGHPRGDSFNRSLADAYLFGAREAGATIEELEIDDLAFDPVLHNGYAQVQELEPDLRAAQEAIERADHLLLSFPVWWGSVPAVLKGFIDRTFLPGWAFRFHDVWPLPEKLLRGRSAHVILTMDSPSPVYNLIYWRSAHRAVIAGTLRFSGFAPVTSSTVGGVKYLPGWLRRRRIAHAQRLGARHARAYGSSIRSTARQAA